MKHIVAILLFSMFNLAINAQTSNFYVCQAQSYQREAAFYMRQADSYQREVDYYRRQTQNYLRDAEYYTRQKKYYKAKVYQDWAKYATDKILINSRKADNARDKAADYMRKANTMLSKNKK